MSLASRKILPHARLHPHKCRILVLLTRSNTHRAVNATFSKDRDWLHRRVGQHYGRSEFLVRWWKLHDDAVDDSQRCSDLHKNGSELLSIRDDGVGKEHGTCPSEPRSLYYSLAIARSVLVTGSAGPIRPKPALIFRNRNVYWLSIRKSIAQYKGWWLVIQLWQITAFTNPPSRNSSGREQLDVWYSHSCS